jgi:hypothetical protein
MLGEGLSRYYSNGRSINVYYILYYYSSDNISDFYLRGHFEWMGAEVEVRKKPRTRDNLKKPRALRFEPVDSVAS